MRAVIYARYSSDLQRDASIEDEVHVCRDRIARGGWTLAGIYDDRALSGASHLRPGYRRLVEDARKGSFEVWRRRSTVSRATRSMSPVS